jgi:hypothetical protein
MGRTLLRHQWLARLIVLRLAVVYDFVQTGRGYQGSDRAGPSLERDRGGSCGSVRTTAQAAGLSCEAAAHSRFSPQRGLRTRSVVPRSCVTFGSHQP